MSVQGQETAKAATSFDAYCALGPQRSLAKLARHWGKNEAYVGQLERWSSQYNWVERAKEYDRERADERRTKREVEIEVMNEEHAVMGHTQALRAIKQIQELIEAKKFGSQAAVQLLKVATDLERVSRGASTEQVAITGKDGEPLESSQVVFYMPRVDKSDEESEGKDGSEVAS